MAWRVCLALVLLPLGPAAADAGQGSSRVVWRDVLSQPEAWYGTAEARTIAAAVVLHQRPSGGWAKDIDMTRPPASPPPATSDATIDNGATTTQIRFLALVITRLVEAASSRLMAGDQHSRLKPAATTAALRGIDYLLAAQYPNGGWPQFFPLRNDYSRHITFNDNAMVNVLELLEETGAGGAPFAFVDDRRRERARAAVARGIPMILSAQIVTGGTRTGWCAQHDEQTLAPRPARTYEHAALSGAETVGIVRFLMRQPRTPEIVRAVDAAVTWLQRVRLRDGRWARFYEIGTNRPIFSGRDGVVRYDISEIEQERRDNYAWYGTWARSLLEKEYPKWKQASRVSVR